MKGRTPQEEFLELLDENGVSGDTQDAFREATAVQNGDYLRPGLAVAREFTRVSGGRLRDIGVPWASHALETGAWYIIDTARYMTAESALFDALQFAFTVGHDGPEDEIDFLITDGKLPKTDTPKERKKQINRWTNFLLESFGNNAAVAFSSELGYPLDQLVTRGYEKVIQGKRPQGQREPYHELNQEIFRGEPIQVALPAIAKNMDRAHNASKQVHTYPNFPVLQDALRIGTLRQVERNLRKLLAEGKRQEATEYLKETQERIRTMMSDAAKRGQKSRETGKWAVELYKGQLTAFNEGSYLARRGAAVFDPQAPYFERVAHSRMVQTMPRMLGSIITSGEKLALRLALYDLQKPTSAARRIQLLDSIRESAGQYLDSSDSRSWQSRPGPGVYAFNGTFGRLSRVEQKLARVKNRYNENLGQQLRDSIVIPMYGVVQLAAVLEQQDSVAKIMRGEEISADTPRDFSRLEIMDKSFARAYRNGAA